jgi:hypothetical protein
MVTTSRSIKLDVRCADNTSTTDDTKSGGRNHSGDNPAAGTAGK